MSRLADTKFGTVTIVPLSRANIPGYRLLKFE